MALTIKSLDSGYDVRLRPVPPGAIMDVIASFDRPKYPMLNLQSDAGTSETARALEDSPEWHEWNAKNAEYTKQTNIAIAQFMATYGILDYRKSSTEDKWKRGAPDDWKVPIDMARFGVKDTDDKYVRWAQFIKYELIITVADEEMVDAVTDAQKPVTRKEIDDAMGPFDSSNE